MSPTVTIILIAAIWIVVWGRALAIWSWFRRRRKHREFCDYVDRLFPIEERTNDDPE